MMELHPTQEKILDNLYKDLDFSFVDEAKFEQTYVPKIQAYVKKLQESQPEKLKIPPGMVPEDFEGFNAISLIEKSNLLSQKELQITGLSATELLAKISSKEFSSVEVFLAYSHRMIMLNQFSNFAFEIFIDEGLLRAKYLDSYLETHGKTIGPLHGLPISSKETMIMKNRVTHQGYASLIEREVDHSTLLVDILQDLGAIFYVRTSEPQTLMHLDTDNNIIGRTRNPNNLSLSVGGSSGGEAACVSGGGSPLGIGGDIGGSLRAPANACGCYSFKPTSRRVPINYGLFGSGNDSIAISYGPFARTAADLDLFMDAVINLGKPWTRDPLSVPLPWSKVDDLKPEKLKIAIVWDDGIVRPYPPIKRGLQLLNDKLKKAGVEVCEFQPIKQQEAFDTVNKLFTLNGCEDRISLLAASGEPLLPLTKFYFTFGSSTKSASIHEFQNYVRTRDNLREEYLNAMNDQQIDFILSPVSPNVAGLPHRSFYWGYTALWNILDMPCSVFPTGLHQDPEIDSNTEFSEYEPRNVYEELEFPNYQDPDKFKNAPICLQLSGRRYQDEKVVAATKMISEILKS